MSKTVAEIKNELKELVVESLELDIDPNDIEDTESLFGGYLRLDSVGTLTLTTAIEDEFDLEIEDEDLTAELFASVNSLAEYINEKVTVKQT